MIIFVSDHFCYTDRQGPYSSSYVFWGKEMKIIAALIVLIALYGCASGSAIVTGTTRSAISPSEVKIYIDPPEQYETMGIVEASSDVEFSAQAAQDRTINELKAQAAKLGANGVILQHSGDKSGDMVGFYSEGVFYAGTGETKVARGKAIYVPNK